MGALNAIVRFASVIMLPLGVALFLSSAHEGYLSWSCAAAEAPIDFIPWLYGHAAWSDVSKWILSTVGALLGIIPRAWSC